MFPTAACRRQKGDGDGPRVDSGNLWSQFWSAHQVSGNDEPSLWWLIV